MVFHGEGHRLRRSVSVPAERTSVLPVGRLRLPSATDDAEVSHAL